VAAIDGGIAIATWRLIRTLSLITEDPSFPPRQKRLEGRSCVDSRDHRNNGLSSLSPDHHRVTGGLDLREVKTIAKGKAKVIKVTLATVLMQDDANWLPLKPRKGDRM
jgi:hypothetical protein